MARWRVIACVRDEGAQGAWRGHVQEFEAGDDPPTADEAIRLLRDRGLETHHIAAIKPADDDQADPHADIGYRGRTR